MKVVFSLLHLKSIAAYFKQKIGKEFWHQTEALIFHYRETCSDVTVYAFTYDG